MRKIQKNDEVILLAGKDKGRRGTVEQVLINAGKVIVTGLNQVKKHVKPNPQTKDPGGIIPKSMPLDISNVAIYNTETSKADRVGIKTLEDGKVIRIFKSTGEPVEI